MIVGRYYKILNNNFKLKPCFTPDGTIVKCVLGKGKNKFKVFLIDNNGKPIHESINGWIIDIRNLNYVEVNI